MCNFVEVWDWVGAGVLVLVLRVLVLRVLVLVLRVLRVLHRDKDKMRGAE